MVDVIESVDISPKVAERRLSEDELSDEDRAFIDRVERGEEAQAEDAAQAETEQAEQTEARNQKISDLQEQLFKLDPNTDEEEATRIQGELVNLTDPAKSGQVEADPLIDPITVAAAGAGTAGKLAIAAGKPLLTAATEALIAAGVGGTAEFGVGFSTEKLLKDHPDLKLPFTIFLGFLTGATVERAAEVGILKGGRRLLSFFTKTRAKKLANGVEKSVADIEAVLETVTKGAKDDPKGLEVLAKAAQEEIDVAERPAKQTIDEVKDLFGSGKYDDLVDVARRGERPRETAFAEGEELAQSMDLDDIRAIMPGTAMNDGQASAVIQIVSRAGDDVIASARKAVASGDPNDIDSTLRQFIAMGLANPARRGVIAESGRTLGVLNDPIATINRFLDQFDEVLTKGTDIDKQRLVEMLAELNNSREVAGFVEGVIGDPSPGGIKRWWYFAMLSGLKTQVKNFAGNMGIAMGEVAKRALAARFSVSAIEGGVADGEASAMAYAMGKNLTDAYRLAKRSFIRKETLFGTFKGEGIGGVTEIGEDAILKGGDHARALDVLAAVWEDPVGTPQRLLLAGDDFWKHVNFKGEAAAQAYRRASFEGLTGDDFGRRVAELEETMPRFISGPAQEAALERTLTNPFTTEAGQGFRKLIDHPIGTIIMPFKRTPVRLAQMAYNSTPLSLVGAGIDRLAGRRLRTKLLADIESGDPARRAIALAQVALGSATMATFSTLTMAGLVTGGGPRDPNLQREWREKFQPYSVWNPFSEEWHSYGGIEPISVILGLAADYTDIALHITPGEREALASELIYATARNFTRQTFIRGIADWLAAIVYPERTLGNPFSRLAGSMVPTIAADISRQIDPTRREVRAGEGVPGFLRETMNEMIRRTPAGGVLKPSRNLYGDPVIYQGALGPDIASPIYTHKPKPSAVNDEILRLQMSIELPGNQIEGVPLTPNEQDRYHFLSGKGKDRTGKDLHGALLKLINSEQYKSPRNTDDPKIGTRALRIRSVIRDFREKARDRVKGEFKRLRDAISDRKKAASPQNRGLSDIEASDLISR